MTEAEARLEIETLTQFDVYPTLTTTEVDLLLAKARRADRYDVPPDAYAYRRASTTYSAGAVVVPATRNGYYYTGSAGTTGSGVPVWPTTSGGTVVDGTVTWTESGAAPWEGTWNLPSAIALGWQMKAGKVAAAYDFATHDQRFTRSQMHKQCLEQAKQWRNRSGETITLRGTGALTYPVVDEVLP